jgi:hypothetical protein
MARLFCPGGEVKLEPVVTQEAVTVRLGRGGIKPSTVPLVTMGMHLTTDPHRMIVIEMTCGQAMHLSNALVAAIAGTEIPVVPGQTPPETT